MVSVDASGIGNDDSFRLRKAVPDDPAIPARVLLDGGGNVSELPISLSPSPKL